MMVSAKNEYTRRGCPASSTRWSVADILRYQTWRVQTLGEGSADMGAYAHKLPAAKGVTPAELPAELLAWEKSQPFQSTQVTEAAKVKPVRKAPPPPVAVQQPEVPEQGYTSYYDKSLKKWVLSHPSLEEKVVLQAKPKVYPDAEGASVVYVTAETWVCLRRIFISHY